MAATLHHIKNFDENAIWYMNSDIWRYDASAGTFNGDYYNSSTYDYFDDNMTAGDYIIFSFYAIPIFLRLYIGTAIAADSISLAWEYCASNDGSTWNTLTVADGTENFSRTGQCDIYWDMPNDYKDWQTNTPAPREETGYNGHIFTIRCRVTSATNPTEGGAQSTQQTRYGAFGIDINGFSEETPCTFDDIYTAELAGTRTLMPPITCTTNINPLNPRPMEQGAIRVNCTLSGTSAGAGDTISITGTGADDETINESIDVSAGNGTYTSAYSYKTINDVDCNGWTDGTIEINQGRWGAMGKTGTDNFYFEEPLYVREGYLKGTNLSLDFGSCRHFNTGSTENIVDGIYVGNRDTAEWGWIQLGELDVTNDYSYDGCEIHGCRLSCASMQANNRHKFYGCAFNFNYNIQFGSISNRTHIDIRDCIIDGGNIFTGTSQGSGGFTYKRCYLVNYGFWAQSPCEAFEDMQFLGTGLHAYFYSNNQPYLIKGLKSMGAEVNHGSGQEPVVYLKDCNFGTSSVTSGKTGENHRQWTLTIHVTDTDGADIENAKITLIDSQGNDQTHHTYLKTTFTNCMYSTNITSFDVDSTSNITVGNQITFGFDGKLDETLTVDTIPDSDTFTTTTGTTNRHCPEEMLTIVGKDVVTNSNGELTCFITHTKDTNAIQTNYSPITVTISKAGYISYKGKLDLDQLKPGNGEAFGITQAITLHKVKDLNFSTKGRVHSQG